MDIGSRIAALRKEKGYTLAELGQLVGVGASTVRKWETGFIENMRSDKIEKLATALGTTPAFIMGWSEKGEEGSNPAPAKRKLRSVARLEDTELTAEEDLELQNFIDFVLAKRERDKK